jgi:hypothetical protein
LSAVSAYFDTTQCPALETDPDFNQQQIKEEIQLMESQPINTSTTAIDDDEVKEVIIPKRILFQVTNVIN